MADPRTFTVAQTDSSATGGNSGTSDRSKFFSSLGKVGDVQALNDIGGGKIGSGLRTLASVSDSIRTGCGSLPTTIGSSIERGADWVLEQTGIASTVVTALQPFHPEVANQAYGQAKQIYNHVKQGSFSASMIPNYIQDFQNLERLGRGLYTSNTPDSVSSTAPHRQASPYAIDLLARAPKYKFLFVVQFIPNAGYSGLGNALGPLDMAFAVKKSSRPEWKETVEDVNFYNYRSKVATKTEFSEMTMSFHDDILNMATGFYTAYMRASTPITNLYDVSQDMLEELSMGFDDGVYTKDDTYGITISDYASSKGLLANDEKTIFKEIRLYHVYNSGNKVTIYHFYNPRITNMSLDDLDMSVGSEGSELNLSFVYDHLHVSPDLNFKDVDISGTQRGAMYPLRYNDGKATSAPSGALNPYSVTPVKPTDNCNPLNTTNTNNKTGGGLGASTDSSNLSRSFSNPLGLA